MSSSAGPHATCSLSNFYKKQYTWTSYVYLCVKGKIMLPLSVDNALPVKYLDTRWFLAFMHATWIVVMFHARWLWNMEFAAWWRLVSVEWLDRIRKKLRTRPSARVQALSAVRIWIVWTSYPTGATWCTWWPGVVSLSIYHNGFS